jgi:ParB family transcriptional regulator, chromosome partitioning protein
MARRRLAPVAAPDVPRAERFEGPGPRETKSLSAPIASVARDTAAAAALEELAASVTRAREEGRLLLDLPLDAIAPDHLARDRIPREDEDMAALRESIRAHGQRTPVEVVPLAGALPYGLISGWRRLAALRALHAETGDARFATARALVCRPETAEAAYVNMVEENEIRVGLSYWERARVAARATERGVFASEKQALLALFATASRPKRSRIRAFLELYHALDGALRFPQALPERLGLRLVERVRAGETARIAEALRRADPGTPEAELAVLQEVVAPGMPRGRPERAREFLPGVRLEERLRGQTLTLTLKGRAVTPELRAEILELLGRLRDPRR